MQRNLNWLNVFGNLFIVLIFGLSAFVYYIFMFIVNYPKLQGMEEVSLLRITYLILCHASLIMFYWCFIQTILTDPGKVPLFWGFHINDLEVRKRRYCLICHIFKPERCHHCSVCNRCVLNMDHHCPWLNNCVGFYNRKFFLLVLFYAELSIILVLSGMLPSGYEAIKSMIFDFNPKELFDDACILFSTVILSVLIVVLTLFFRYHIQLLVNNSTTIEDLERRRSNIQLNYDIGIENNFYQIFGLNAWLWPLPLFAESGKPMGDGVSWDQRFVNNDAENQQSAQMATTISTDRIKCNA